MGRFYQHLLDDVICTFPYIYIERPLKSSNNSKGRDLSERIFIRTRSSRLHRYLESETCKTETCGERVSVYQNWRQSDKSIDSLSQGGPRCMARKELDPYDRRPLRCANAYAVKDELPD